MKFLIDECLSPVLVAVARDRGFVLSTHVVWLGLSSKKDWTIVRHAVDEGYVLVTNNTVDFTSLVSLEVQRVLFEHALDQLAGEEPVNEVLEINLSSGERVRADRYTWPSDRRR